MNKHYKKVYICYPYADDPDKNIEKGLQIVEEITLKNCWEMLTTT